MQDSPFSRRGGIGVQEPPTGTAQLEACFRRPVQSRSLPKSSCAARHQLARAGRTPMRRRPYVEIARAEVAQRARRLWDAAGRPDGRDCQFWLEAELEILGAALASLQQVMSATALEDWWHASEPPPGNRYQRRRPTARWPDRFALELPLNDPFGPLSVSGSGACSVRPG